MSKLFYSYLIDSLLVEYLKNNPAQPGEHYCLLVEDNNERRQLLDAIRASQHARPLTVESIFEGKVKDRSLDRFETVEFRPAGDVSAVPLIVADVNEGGEYLPTIRNAVNAGRRYGDKGTLFLLSNYESVDTLSTASINLESPGMPFNIQSIFENISAQIQNSAALSNNEKYYIRHKIEAIRTTQTDDYTLFDFQDVLEVMEEKQLKGHFSELGFFPDNAIYDSGIGKGDMEERAKLNYDLYSQVNSIMGNFDPEARKVSLAKLFEDNLVDRLCRDGVQWELTDFEDVQRSYESRRFKSDLLVDRIEFYDSSGSQITEDCLVTNTLGKAKKQRVETIICVPDNKITVKIVFNKNFDRKIISKDFPCNKVNRILSFCLTDAVLFSVGEGANKHSFVFALINADHSDFDGINKWMQLSVTKKKTPDIKITVRATQDVRSLVFGSGTRQMTTCDVIDWHRDMRIEFSAEDADEDSQVSQKIRFPGQTAPVEFIFKFDSVTILNKSAFDIFEAVWTGGKPYHDARLEQNGGYTYSVIGNESDECSTPMKNEYRALLLLEQKMIDDNALSLKGVSIENSDCVRLDLGSVTEQPDMKIPDSVRDALMSLFEYYRRHNTVPTLCPVDDELQELLAAYVGAVKKEIASIRAGEYMTSAQYGLTGLGTVRFLDGRIWLSPFHPLLAAFLLELSQRFDRNIKDSNVLKLIGPYYLLPYLTFEDTGYSPRIDHFTEELKTWVCYSPLTDHEQNHAQNIAVKMVKEKMDAFLSQMEFLFPDKECPLIINTFGISDDTHIIKGIIQFVVSQYSSKETNFRVQRVILHEYVDNILTESLLEKLNRLGSDALIGAELRRIGIRIDTDRFTIREIIHQIFSRVSLYKHELSDDMVINYSHLSFYQIRTGLRLRTPKTDELRVEMSLGGLISEPATLGVRQEYTIGFGTRGMPEKTTVLIETAQAMNSLFANESQMGRKSPYAEGLCVAKNYVFKEDRLLNEIYDNSNWVTFLNPEVDLDFFYNQDVYIVYYTDQYSINSRYDSITVTRQIERYQKLLENSFSSYSALASTDDMKKFNSIVLAYFNCLNGRWLMDISHKQPCQVREKISLIAALKVIAKMLGRMDDIIWIPVSLEEILRVSGSVGLPKDSLFSVKSLKAGGMPMSDDLLMMGCRIVPGGKVSLFLYPVEVKASQNAVYAEKGKLQLAHTCVLLRDNLTGAVDFVKDVYRTFFASIFLGNADKLVANTLLAREDYDRIQTCRYKLLNGEFDICVSLPTDEFGVAALVTVNKSEPQNIGDVCDGIPFRHLNIRMGDCASIITDTYHEDVDMLMPDDLPVSESFMSTLTVFRNGEEKAVEESLEENEQVPDDEIEETVRPEENEADEEADDNTDRRISILVGHTASGSNVPVYFYPNDTRQVSHPNLGIIGTMGTGKTQFARSVIAQLSRESVHNVGHTPIGMLVFDYKGDYNKSDFLDAVNGECFNIKFPFNPLKLIVTPNITSVNLPAITADRIADSMRKAFRLGDVQYTMIKDALLDTYAEAGITRDPSTWNMEPPTMSDVVRLYLERHDAKDKVYSIFRNLDDYSLFASDNSQCVSLFEWLNGVKVIDLTLFTDNIKKLVVSLILDLFYAEMQQLGESRQIDGFREIRAMILVDEAHQFMKMKFDSLRRIISEGRAFGVGMILSTQNLSDFRTDEDYATFFKSWVVHGVNNPLRSELAVVFGATDPKLESYMRFLNNAKTFDSICRIGSLVSVIRDYPYFRLIEEDMRFAHSAHRD